MRESLQNPQQADKLLQKAQRLEIALHDAINRPIGVVPDSAVEFYEQDKERER